MASRPMSLHAQLHVVRWFCFCVSPSHHLFSVSCWRHQVSCLGFGNDHFHVYTKFPWLWGEPFGDPGGLRGGCAELQVLVEVTVELMGRGWPRVGGPLRPSTTNAVFCFLCISPPSFSIDLCTLHLWSPDSWILIFSGLFFLPALKPCINFLS